MQFVLLPAMVALALGGCSGADDGGDGGSAVPASGTGTSRSYAVSDFTEVATRGSDDVDVRVGTAFSVRAEGPSAELDRLRVTRSGRTLEVGRKPGVGLDWSGHKAVRVYVTMPRITAAAIAGSGDIRIDRAEGQSFGGSVSGSGTLGIAALSVRDAKFSLSGSGDIEAAGNVQMLTIDSAGSGEVKAAALHAARASVSVAGSGDVRADVAGPARVSSVGSGDIDLGAKAHCATSKAGSGSVRCGG